LDVDASTRDLLLAQDGDDDAFSRVIRLCEADVRRFSSWFSSSGYEVDDVAQETFLRAYRGLQSYRGDSTATSWLLSIARRVCLDSAEKKKKEESLAKQLMQVQKMKADEGYSTEIRHLIAALPLQYREAFVLVRVLGYRYEEAATVLNCPRGTVQSRVARARHLLAQQVTADEARQTS
jgi:RNA polymerase sigma-70 factor (ECF subfamily)